VCHVSPDHCACSRAHLPSAPPSAIASHDACQSAFFATDPIANVSAPEPCVRQKPSLAHWQQLSRLI